jgi:hypothetical protein
MSCSTLDRSRDDANGTDDLDGLAPAESVEDPVDNQGTDDTSTCEKAIGRCVFFCQWSAMPSRQIALTANDIIALLRIGTGEGDIEVIPESRQAKHGADDGRVVAVREGTQCSKEDDQEVVSVSLGSRRSLDGLLRTTVE